MVLPKKMTNYKYHTISTTKKPISKTPKPKPKPAILHLHNLPNYLQLLIYKKHLSNKYTHMKNEYHKNQSKISNQPGQQGNVGTLASMILNHKNFKNVQKVLNKKNVTQNNIYNAHKYLEALNKIVNGYIPKNISKKTLLSNYKINTNTKSSNGTFNFTI
jgi:hypothetical protein